MIGVENKNRAVSLHEEFNFKCGYCEQKEEMMNVEHYRPKKDYDWLSKSWDNLVLSCPKCNFSKGTKFPIQNLKVNKSLSFEKRIDNCSKIYNRIEKSLLLNPKLITKPEFNFEFNNKGEILGITLEGKTTIDICKLNRKHLNDKRLKILNELQKTLNENILLENFKNVQFIIEKFILTIKNSKVYEFIAYRKYILKNYLKSMI